MLLALPKLVSLVVFQPLESSNMTLVFLPPNVTSVVQPLDQGIIASSKKKFLRWVLSQYYDATFEGLKEGGAQHHTSYHVEL
jgi:hypothetical protein